MLSGKKSKNQSTRQPVPKTYKKVARALREALNTNVKVKTVQGRNKIEIEFQDETDLERLFEELTSKPQ